MGRDPLEPVFSGDEEDSGHPASPPTFAEPPQETRVWPKRRRFKKTTASRHKLSKSTLAMQKLLAEWGPNPALENWLPPDHDEHFWDPDYVDEDEQPPPATKNKQQEAAQTTVDRVAEQGGKEATTSGQLPPNATGADEEVTTTPPDTDNELPACQCAELNDRPRPTPLSVLLEENPDYDPMEALISNEDYQRFWYLSHEIRAAITQAEKRIVHNKQHSLQFGVSGSLINRLALSTAYGTDLDVVLGFERGSSYMHIDTYTLQKVLRDIGFIGKFPRQPNDLPWFKPVYRGYMGDVNVDLSLDNSGIRLNRLIGAFCYYYPTIHRALIAFKMHAKEHEYAGAARECTSMTGYLIVFLHFLKIKYELPTILKLEAMLQTGDLHHWPKSAKFTSSTKTDWRVLLQEFCTHFVEFDYNGVPELHVANDRPMPKQQYWDLMKVWEVPESYRRQHGSAMVPDPFTFQNQACRTTIPKEQKAARHITDLCKMLKEAY
ncbi:hypothetical protein M3Y99_00331900 [Aphelenchoides fujianensis]|nr:hypothetical protein M3Y99_00331900 [Aphelenchoides fujianensis]